MPLSNPAGSSSSGGGLTYTATKTGNYTAAASEYVVCNATSSFTVTLPTAPAEGTQIGVLLKALSGTNVVTIAAGGADTISGNHNSKLYVANDFLVLQYNATDDVWYTVDDGLCAHVARMTLSAAITTNTAATSKKVTFNTETFDVGGIADPTTNNRFDIRRAGRYQVTLQCRPNSNVTSTHYYAVAVKLNNTTDIASAAVTSAALSAVSRSGVHAIVSLAAADFVEGYFTAESTNAGCGAGTDDTFMVLHEVR